ncbi:MAG: phage terminase large subunit [Halothiobacillus sp.]|nr:phage terminase large subunit [Halothiobacillus sp.]
MSNIRHSAQKVLAQRELARRNLMDFVLQTTPKYVPGWVHHEVTDALEEFFRQVEAEQSPRLAIYMPPRSGKQISDGTPVFTTQGWKTHGELQVGDYVFHPSGTPVKVIAVSEKTPSDYVVTTSDGVEIRCHGNHDWTVYARDVGQWVTMSTQKLMSLKLTSESPGKRGGRYVYQLPLNGAVVTENIDLPIHPYMLGVWLGDGLEGTPVVTAGPRHRQHLDKCVALGYSTPTEHQHKDHTDACVVRFDQHDGVAGRLTRELQKAGVFENKHVPELFLLAGTEQRRELLAGLIDTGGGVDSESNVTFTSTNRPLVDAVFDLAASLGYGPRLLSSTEPTLPSYGAQDNQTLYGVEFQPTEPLLTALPHKQIARIGVRRKRAIASVRYEPNGEQGHCIQVDSEDGLYMVTRGFVPTHNSELSSIKFPAWALGHRPDLQLVVASYAANLSDEFSKKTREVLRDPEYQNIFPDTRLHKDMAAVDAWKTTQLGGYTAVGVGGGLTGKGANILILDDLYPDRESAESDAYRRRVLNWFTSTAYTRLMPGGGILVLFTRWHEDDLGGYIENLEHENFKVIRYPAIAEEDERNRKAGEALHPERYNEEALARIRSSIGARDWNSLYQQNPVPAEGDLFKSAVFKYKPRNSFPEAEDTAVMVAWDLSTGKSMDYSVGIVAALDRDQDLYILDVIRGRFSAIELVERIIDTHQKYGAQLTGLEVGQIAATIEPMLVKRMNERKAFIRLEKLKPGRANKVGRAMNIIARMEQGKVFFPERAEWLADFEAELLKFPNGRNDDQVDSFAYLGYMLNMAIPPQKREPPKKKSWKDDLHKFINKNSSGKGFMSA